MKNFDGHYNVGQCLMHRVGHLLFAVKFVSLGPRLGHGVGKDAVTENATTAIVMDKAGKLVSVLLDDLQPAPDS